MEADPFLFALQYTYTEVSQFRHEVIFQFSVTKKFCVLHIQSNTTIFHLVVQ